LLSNIGLAKSFRAKALSYASHLINMLPISAIGGETAMEVRSEKVAQDYDLLKIFRCPIYYHIKEDKLEGCVFRFQVKRERLQVVGSKDKKIIVSRDVTFDEPSVMMHPSFQQVETN